MAESSGVVTNGSDKPLVSQTAMDAELLQLELGKAWQDLVHAMYCLRQDGYAVYRVTIRGEWATGDEFLVILCAEHEGRPVVAFHGAENITTVWKRLVRRVEQGTLKWKDDSYAAEQE